MPTSSYIFQSLFILFAGFMLLAGVHTPVYGGIVTTEEIVDARQIETKRDHIKELLSREDVRKTLIAQGVNVAAAQERVDNMSNAEIQTLAANMDQLPAGGALSTIEILLLIIIILLLI